MEKLVSRKQVKQIHHKLRHLLPNEAENIFEYTDKKENKILLIYKEIQSGAVEKSYMRKGLLIYVEMRKYLVTYEAVSHI
jgi:hypothetical protein